MRPLPVLAALLALAGPAFAAGATCSPVDTSAAIYASPDADDVHPDWSDGSTVGLGWTFALKGDGGPGPDGATFLFGDLLDARGNVANTGVYVLDLQWECEAN